MQDQPWDLNQTWPVGRKWCWFTNAPKTFGGPPPSLGHKKHQILDHFFATSALNTAYLRNETSYRQTKMLMSIYNVSPESWPTFRDIWPRNGWDPFAHCDPFFGGHYAATIIVATCLVFHILPYNLSDPWTHAKWYLALLIFVMWLSCY